MGYAHYFRVPALLEQFSRRSVRFLWCLMMPVSINFEPIASSDVPLALVQKDAAVRGFREGPKYVIPQHQPLLIKFQRRTGYSKCIAPVITVCFLQGWPRIAGRDPFGPRPPQ